MCLKTRVLSLMATAIPHGVCIHLIDVDVLGSSVVAHLQLKQQRAGHAVLWPGSSCAPRHGVPGMADQVTPGSQWLVCI
jgi:hypothetical protein